MSQYVTVYNFISCCHWLVPIHENYELSKSWRGTYRFRPSHLYSFRIKLKFYSGYNMAKEVYWAVCPSVREKVFLNTSPSILDFQTNRAHQWICLVKTKNIVKADFLISFFFSLKSKKKMFFSTSSVLVQRRTEAHQWICLIETNKIVEADF